MRRLFGADDEVGLATEQCARVQWAAHFVHDKFDTRFRGTRGLERPADPLVIHRDAPETDAEPAEASERRQSCPMDRFTQAFVEPGSAFDEGTPGRRQGNPSGASLKQHGLHIGLERLQLTGERRLSDTERARRAADAAQLGD
jgi:hypothetical protein